MSAHTTETDAGQRLDVVAAAHFGLSRSRAAAHCEAGEILLDGRAAGKRQRVLAGQQLELRPGPSVAPAPAPPLPPVRYEDEHLLVVAKPAGLVVHPGHGQPDRTLVDALRGAGIPLADVGDPIRPGIVHRLDRDTSGLLVVAKSTRALTGLVEALRRREVARRYLALVQGVPRARRGRIEAPLGRDPRDRTRFAVVDDGRAATTRYAVLGEAPGDQARDVALLACALETGRTHQIRVHLSTLGHPIVGDTSYRGSPALAERLDVPRMVLHAGRLAFRHPVTGVEVALDEPLPDDLGGPLARLGLMPRAAWWDALDDRPAEPDETAPSDEE